MQNCNIQNKFDLFFSFLLISLISSTRFLASSLRFLHKQSRSLKIRTVLVLFHSFHSGCLYFIFFPFIALTRTSSTVLNMSSKRGHSCLVHTLRGKAFSLPSLTMKLAGGILEMFTIKCWGSSPQSLFAERFYHEWVLNLVKYFLYILWDDYMVFYFIDMVNYIYWFKKFNQIYISWHI